MKAFRNIAAIATFAIVFDASRVVAQSDARPPGLKPRLISGGLRGPEGPLFHGDMDICDFFRKLSKRSRI